MQIRALTCIFAKFKGGKNLKKLSVLVTVLFSLFALSACGASDDSSGTDTTGSSTAKSEKQFEGQTLNVVTTSDAYKELFDKFSDETGAKVEFLSMSSGEVLSRMQADQSSEPMADLWFGGGLDAFMQAKTDGLLEQYQSDAVESIDEKYRDPEGYWLSKGLTVGGLLINNDVLEEKGLAVPETWADLADEKYKDEIIMSDPAVSGTMYAIVKGILDKDGNDAGWQYWESVNENIPYYGQRGKDPQEKVTAGEFGIGLIPVDKSAFDAAEENDLSVVYPSDGIPWVPEGVAVFKDAPGKDMAEAFIDFMLQPENMKELAELDGKDTDQIIMPGVDGYDLGLESKDLIDEDLTTFGSDREAILNQWAEMAANK
ncbi:ABC transporter substrate-binding protein [Enterococcus sp. ALS3]|uniref:ABC transporter substrate-binding protein n=1 Tax=Enterococcus alishanensis TaxID=1303817 RepID=A0ABS6TG47_9ENTE|nr:ABC transporter substrate-binding protein [Enterococcus alishanensis]